MFPSTFTTADNLKLKCSLGSTSDDPAALLIIVHGLGEHSESLPYSLIEPFFTERRYAVLKFDLRGHGRSEGPRGHVNSWSDFRNDLKIFVELARRKFKGKPLFLLGASLGGLIVLDHALNVDEKPAGLVLVAPALSADGASWIVRYSVPLLSHLLPKVSIDPRLDLRNISRDRQLATEYSSDPLFSTRLSMRLAGETLNAVSATLADAAAIDLPILIMHGDADEIVPTSSSEHLYAKVSSGVKRRIVYRGAFHNLLLETDRERVYSDIIGWIDDQLPNRNRSHSVDR
ncbi:MAG TPA: alpha/beta hydrolase [Pyrinomonadaceae bacterium]|nr:alpha/beta hydrolase [Pyrinomonadaceae bacterium]